MSDDIGSSVLIRRNGGGPLVSIRASAGVTTEEMRQLVDIAIEADQYAAEQIVQSRSTDGVYTTAKAQIAALLKAQGPMTIPAIVDAIGVREDAVRKALKRAEDEVFRRYSAPLGGPDQWAVLVEV